MTKQRPPRHRRRPRRRHPAPGAPPGTLVRYAEAQPSRITVRRFGPDTFDETILARIDDLAALRDPAVCLWVDVVGLADVDAITSIGGTFGVHDLSLEDVLDPGQRAKVEPFEDYTFVVLKMLAMGQAVEARQLCVFFGEGFVVTLQEAEHADLDPVRERLRHGRGKIRTRGADYLAYALIDAVIDHYFVVLEAFDDYLEHVEDLVLDATTGDPIDLARQARQDLQMIRHAIWPARDAVVTLLGDDMTHVTDETRVYVRDCYDHLVQLQEMVEASREIAASLLEAYISRVSLRTNDVMKVLTVIATVFIPLTFITGLYGMNFNPARSPLNMPELNWYWGYPFALLLMVGAVAGSLLYFRRQGWFGSRGRGSRRSSPEQTQQERGGSSSTS